MDIPNLSQNTTLSTPPKNVSKNPVPIIVIVCVLAITAGFWISRFFPSKTAVSLSDIETTVGKDGAVQIANGEDIQVGVLYGNTAKEFKDSATGTIEKGNINGEGTHILNREGGATQRAALTSSVVDLDLFAGKKVEVKGETNKSNKAAWLMDVGSIKILE